MILLKKITNVYRFSSPQKSWSRISDSPENHFIAYKLYGCTDHFSGGNVYTHKKDTVMIANGADSYDATQEELPRPGQHGGCIAVHFTTVTPFELHLSICDCAEKPQVRREFFRMLDSWDQFTAMHDPAAEYECISHFYAALAQLPALSGQAESAKPNGSVQAARAYLCRNYADSTLSVADAAETARLSTRRFGDLFLQQYHTTPGRYLTSLRISAAVSLLQEERLSVAEIAAAVGYGSASYFIRVFHRETGASPDTYRKQLNRP